MSKSSFYHISPTGEMTTLPDLKEALKATSGKGYVWFDYVHATREDLSLLIEPLSLHPLSIEDCTDENQVPKTEDFQNYSFIIFNALYYKDYELVTDEVDIFAGSNFIVTVSGYSESTRLPLANIELLVQRNLPGVKGGPSRLMHIILDSIVDMMASTVETIEEEIDIAEEAILDLPAAFDATKLIHLRRNLLSLRKSLFHEREILMKIVRNDCHFVPEKATVHFRDIYDHLSNFFEMTESNRDNVTGLMELYASMLNNQMARDSNQTNASVRRLTLITTIFMPLTLLAGIFGMSEWTMMTGPDKWKSSYLLFGAMLLLIGIGNYFFIRWLERRDVKNLK
jgi:magnesium transporter